MSVFKTFFSITKSNAIAIMVYLGVALAMCVALSLSSGGGSYNFESVKVNVAVVDEDESEVSKALVSYLKENENFVETPEDKDLLQDALFFGDIQYLLTIPAGFEEAVEKDEDVKLSSTSSPNSYNGAFVDMKIEGFINAFRSYKALGIENTEALSKAAENLSKEAATETYVPDNAEKSSDSFKYFFYFAGYGIMTVLIHCIASIMVVFNKPDMIKRMNCSALSVKKRNFYIVAGNLIIMFVAFLLFVGIVTGFNFDELRGNAIAPYLFMNLLMFALFCMALGYFVGTFAKHDGHIAIFSVSFSMILSFLGGIFVPAEFFTKGMQVFSKFIPTTWYTSNIDMLFGLKKMTGDMLPDFLRNIGVLAAFTVAVLGIAYSISARRAQEAEA
ncbi:MAG: ABC transporter permease [Lachnospiraceae bacterium]|nr:ABC transporter permease [Lachnospiraceae bacterium]